MVRRVGFTVLLPAMLFTLALPGTASAGRLTVLCSNGYRAVFEELVPQFERATRHTVDVTYGLSAALKRQIDDGAVFDVAVLTPAAIDDLIAKGRVVRGTRTELAQSPMALAVRSGAARPDVGTKAALLRTLDAAASIAYAKEGAAGVFFIALAERLGIATSLQPKTRTTTTGAEVAAAVARGDATLGILPMSEILPVAGIQLLGTFPGDTHGSVMMTAGLKMGSGESQAATALFSFLTSPAVQPVLKRHGMER